MAVASAPRGGTMHDSVARAMTALRIQQSRGDIGAACFRGPMPEARAAGTPSPSACSAQPRCGPTLFSFPTVGSIGPADVAQSVLRPQCFQSAPHLSCKVSVNDERYATYSSACQTLGAISLESGAPITRAYRKAGRHSARRPYHQASIPDFPCLAQRLLFRQPATSR